MKATAFKARICYISTGTSWVQKQFCEMSCRQTATTDKKAVQISSQGGRYSAWATHQDLTDLGLELECQMLNIIFTASPISLQLRLTGIFHDNFFVPLFRSEEEAREALEVLANK